SLDVYATHLPSAENMALIGTDERTESNGVSFRSRSEKIDNETLAPVVASNNNSAPPGAHDCGAWNVPGSALVRRSAGPVPSASCQKIDESPSRSDWNAIR